MAKTTKKKNRRLKRQIRKTVGALLMVSAITVAAIPVQDVSANPTVTEKIKVAVTSTEGVIKTATDGYASTVPYVKDCTSDLDKTVYTSGNGKFKFAYIRNRGAVILEYTDAERNSDVTIPTTLNAYRSYADNFQNASYYCLVSESNELLGYMQKNQPLVDGSNKLLFEITYEKLGQTVTEEINQDRVRQEDGKWVSTLITQVYKVLEDGTTDTSQIENIEITVDATQKFGERYYPCFYDSKDIWENIPDEQLYYLPYDKNTGKDDYGNWKEAKSDTTHWKIEANVCWIGSEKVKTVNSGSGWELNGVRNTVGDGVFSNAFWIRNLQIDAVLDGVGDYAFYQCSQLSSVKFQTGLNTLGNGAFAECQALSTVDIPDARAIGKDAFYNCTALKDFQIPAGTLTHLGDCAFEGCTSLNQINFSRLGSSEPVTLKKLGNHLFWGCTALSSVEFPNGYFEDVALDIDMFYGCKSLQAVILPNTDSGAQIKFDDGHHNNTDYPRCTTNTWDEFRKNTVPEAFYFEGPERSEIHTIAGDNSLTYKYPNENLYEKVTEVHDVEDGTDTDADLDKKSARVFYKVRVDSNNVGKIEEFGILNRKGTDTPSRPDIIEIPEAVGTFGITEIDEGSFNNNCDLAKVTIPASVTKIGDNAFRGCHRLETVIFKDASAITDIGNDAFRTQVVASNCKDTLYPGKDPDGNKVEKPKLYFVGDMMNEEGQDTEPFIYAMSGNGKISNDEQPEDIWITCNSGWPTNLEVQYFYNVETKEKEARLVGYPRYEQITDPSWVKNLPYVTSSAQIDSYNDTITNVMEYLGNNDRGLSGEGQKLLPAIRDIVIPNSVTSIQDGLFSGVNKEGKNVDAEGNVVDETSADKLEADSFVKTITLNGVKTIEPYTFKDTVLEGVSIIGSSYMDDYAFDDCKNLVSVTLGSNLEDMGRRPFKGCEKLPGIDCTISPYFSYKDGILYRNTDNGLEIVECLEGRGKAGGTMGSTSVGPDELQGVVSIKPEAFSECMDIMNVDLSNTFIESVPENCFKKTNLSSVILPKTLASIDEGAFQDGLQRNLSVTFTKSTINPIIAPDAFKNEDPSKQQKVTLYTVSKTAPAYAKNENNKVSEDYIFINENVPETCRAHFFIYPEGPVAGAEYVSLKDEDGSAVVFNGNMEDLNAFIERINYTCNNSKYIFDGWENRGRNEEGDFLYYAKYVTRICKVTFRDGITMQEIGTPIQKEYGQGVSRNEYPVVPDHTDEGWIFKTWKYKDDVDPTNVTDDIELLAYYEKMDDDNTEWCEISVYCDDSGEPWIHIEKHPKGTVYTPPKAPPAREGYTFKEWRWTPADSKTAVNEKTIIDAVYERNGSSGNNPNASPGNSGNNGNSGNGSGSNSSPSPSSSTSPSPSSTPGVKKYTVSVSGGSGSGEYAAGEIVAVNAYYMGEGQAFDKWTSSTAGVGFSNPNATSATFTMPAANVAVTATYKTGSGNSITPVSTNSGGGGGSNTVNTVSNNGTTVDVTRPGISNTNLAGATVSGATDNFIVKVTEDQAATDAVTAALQARYGDLSRIKYLPMDISLYDSTGRTKIADTSGISVNLTLPLPDDLVQYAGNNRVAAVSGGVLEDLNARFTTVGGVPCVNFTATHFSPYVIYVDTANLSEAVIDATPKTGDPIHPKWFLAIGLACISLVLFFKRDKKVVINAKAA